LTADEITDTVVLSLFPPRRWAVCPNVSWGLLPWEADILAISNTANRIHEIEVKVTASDLKRDLYKTKWGIGKDVMGLPSWNSKYYSATYDARKHVHHFWYAVSEDLKSHAMVQAEKIGCGVIVCYWDEKSNSLVPVKEKYPKLWPGPSMWSAATMRTDLYRLCSLRFWETRKLQKETI
jgi:hypothetical protein